MIRSKSTPLTRLLCVVLVTAILVGGVGTASPASTAGLVADQEPTDQLPATAHSSTAPTDESAAELELEVVEESPETVTVSLSTTAENTVAYAAALEFDPDVATVESIDGVDFESPYANVEDGRVTFTQSTIPDEAVDAPELARITFDLAAGETELSFVESDTIVENADIEEVPLSMQGVTIDADGGSAGAPDTGDRDPDASDESADSGTDATDNSDAAAPGSSAGTADPGASGDDADRSDGGEGGSPDVADPSGDDAVPGFAGSAGVLAVLALLAFGRRIG
ncbi:hypothetical protein [Halovivax limisalsi]|uniref:hypothetical protein n=1 Tax=Halovivax limisalsi TaxID=1453760 RepID=UPI001FFDDF59|nr:hypothetical protein [Halovivax limisalsi]